ncbi:MAG: endonuclease/exonuclease/phosphatase family protein [Clostridia bacterium]|nr:endonuclease/exonuclease/phosphatase family protein [Clostridia bacterium]
MKIRVISQNVMCWEGKHGGKYEERRPRIKEVLRRDHPDLIGMQEVTPGWKAYFDEDFADYKCLFKYRAKESLEAMPIYYNPETVELIEGGFFWLSKTPDVESIDPCAACYRITTWGRFRTKADGHEFAYINTHLDCDGPKARIRGIKIIGRFAKKKFGKKLPLLLTGDFNDVEGSRPIRYADRHFTNTRYAAKDTTDKFTFTDEYGVDAPSQTIDYVYMRGDMTCESFDVRECSDGMAYQSDHLAVTAVVEI